MGQLIKRENIRSFVEKLQAGGKTVVVTNGCFDILHVGHVRYLQKTKSPADLIDEIKPDVYTKGADYTMETLPEADVVRKNNIRVEFITFVEGQSTTNLINKINNKE